MTRSARSRSLVAAVIVLTLGAAGAEASAEDGLVAYRGATLIDGRARLPVENATVLVRGDRFVSAGADVEIPDGARVVDVSGTWIVPGLIDAHVHFMISARLYTRPNMLDLTEVVPYEAEVAWIQENLDETLRSTLCAGVTGVISAGGPFIEYEARDRARAMPDAPTVFVSHGPITQVPVFMAQRFFPLFDGDVTLKSARSPEAGAALVREGAEREADLIKTVYDAGGSILRRWLQYRYVSIHEAIVSESAKHGFKVTTHAHELEPARNVVAAGVDSLQHVPADEAVDEAFVTLLRERRVIVVPTLAIRQRTFSEVFEGSIELLPIERRCTDPSIIRSWSEVEGLSGPTDARIQRVADGTAMATANTKALHEGGVEIAAGTDAGNIALPHGASLHLELRKLSEVGLSPMDVLAAATIRAAKVAGREADHGSIEAGKFADFLVLSEDPLADVANLQAIDLVVKHGRAFAPDELAR
ncbi:MAG: amidohydrolase family protein [Myxococcota bacterium]|nr:amidohydrolase family protein [Myxococcota bacterium]